MLPNQRLNNIIPTLIPNEICNIYFFLFWLRVNYENVAIYFINIYFNVYLQTNKTNKKKNKGHLQFAW